MEEVEEKKKKNIWKMFKKLPKIFRWCITVLLFLFLISLGLIIKKNYLWETKTLDLQLENVGKLVTQTAHVVELGNIEYSREIFDIEIPFTESKQLFSIQVDVDAYVDFEQITHTRNKTNKMIVIKLPHAQIGEATILDETMEVYLDKESIFSRINLEKQAEARLKIRDEAIKKAKKNGLLEAADRNAQTIIEKVIKSDKNYADYTITFNYIGE